MAGLSKLVADFFIASITERPDDFEYRTERYTLQDTKTGVVWWVANGATFFGMYEPVESKKPSFIWPGIQRLRCWRAFRKWQKAHPTPRELRADEKHVLGLFTGTSDEPSTFD